MTESQRSALLAYFRQLATVLGADHWELSVSMAPASDTTAASLFLQDNHDAAVLHVPPDFFTQPASTQRRDLVHEALHLVLDRGPRAWEDAIEDLTPAGFDQALNRTPRRLHERGVEQLARHLEHWLALPDLPR